MKKNIKKNSDLEKEFEELLNKGHYLPPPKPIKNVDVNIDELEKEFDNMLNGHNLPPGKDLSLIEKDKYLEEMENDLKKLDEEEEKPTLNLTSNYVMKKRLGELFNFTTSHEIETNNDTVNLISQIVNDKYIFVQKKMKRKYKQGFETAVKLTFLKSLEVNGASSITIRSDAMTEEVIKERITRDIINKFHGGDSEFLPLFKYATYFIFPLAINGGCSCDKTIMEKNKI